MSMVAGALGFPDNEPIADLSGGTPISGPRPSIHLAPCMRNATTSIERRKAGTPERDMSNIGKLKRTDVSAAANVCLEITMG